MLTVIQQQQQLLAAQKLDHDVPRGVAGSGGQREHRGDRILHTGDTRTGARSHSHVPLPNRGDTCPAICNARRVFPTPPGPVKVTTRASPNAAAICSSSLALPMNEVTCNGKLPLRPASVRIGGKSAGRSAWVS